MGRMTEKGPYGYYIPAGRGEISLCSGIYGKGDVRYTGSIADRLGRYEECGMEPEEVQQMAHDWTKYETAMSYVDEIGGIEVLKRMVMEGKR